VTDAAAHPLKTTPLATMHRKLGAKMVPFAGYEMPLQYRGILAEHVHTRERASLFDVSHMGQAILRAADAAAALETLVVGDLRNLEAGRVRYTLLTNETGGILDDLMVVNGGSYLVLVVNAARKDADFAHIRERIGDRVDMEVWDDRALLALQGPAAATVVARLAPPARHMLFMTMANLHIGGVLCGLTRSGYTGEDGFEITVPADRAREIAELLLAEKEVKPAGLGARDTLRLEAGLCLYGNDITTETTPIEAGLAWTIGQARRKEGGFPGADVILRQLAEGPKRKRVGLKLDGRVPARAGATISSPDGTAIGAVTSGGFGPTVQAPIAMGYIDADKAAAGTRVAAIVRDKPLPAEVVKLPFVPHKYMK
jgi:aminomethyltransferase